MGFFDILEKQSKEIQLSLIENRIKALTTGIKTEVTGDVLDNLLYLMLNAMSMLFIINDDYRKNIKDFTGTYVICSKDNMIDVSVKFKKVRVLGFEQDGMKVKDTIIDNPTSMVTFKDGKSMADFLLSGNPDVFVGMLNNQLSVSGNLNYLFKFVYLLQLIPDLLGIDEFQKLLKAS
ncbi:MAG: hypothetical protein HN356_09900 [Calditrichaeota bacterium]|nr:hypothetical protein [Calditrichota bacterium]MBT7618103.1 hypothetical protein [Calditrichota bacterium]